MQQRIRMFAGPNGSGKSGLVAQIRHKLNGRSVDPFLNADEIEAALRTQGGWICPVPAAQTWLFDLRAAFLAAGWLPDDLGRQVASQIAIADAAVTVPLELVNSYVASVLADWARRKLLAAGLSFSFETVMSSSDKLEFLREARHAGARIYLYFVCTSDPDIHVGRVRNRVRSGGHAVPEDKIRKRYEGALGHLREAIVETDRAYVFDNSGSEPRLELEFDHGQLIKSHVDAVSGWVLQRCF